MKTILDAMPDEMRLDTQIREKDKYIIAALDELYARNGTFLPQGRVLDGNDPFDIETYENYAEMVRRMLYREDVPIDTKIDEREAFYLSSRIAQLTDSVTVYPRLSRSNEQSEDDSTLDEISLAVRESIDLYLSKNPAIRDIIEAHIDLISNRESRKDHEKPVPVIMAGYAFMMIELRNLHYYVDGLKLQKMEQEFFQ